VAEAFVLNTCTDAASGLVTGDALGVTALSLVSLHCGEIVVASAAGVEGEMNSKKEDCA
jgi:hypothetical protein